MFTRLFTGVQIRDFQGRFTIEQEVTKYPYDFAEVAHTYCYHQ
jgi:hypothetical protein